MVRAAALAGTWIDRQRVDGAPGLRSGSLQVRRGEWRRVKRHRCEPPFTRRKSREAEVVHCTSRRSAGDSSKRRSWIVRRPVLSR